MPAGVRNCSFERPTADQQAACVGGKGRGGKVNSSSGCFEGTHTDFQGRCQSASPAAVTTPLPTSCFLDVAFLTAERRILSAALSCTSEVAKDAEHFLKLTDHLFFVY